MSRISLDRPMLTWRKDLCACRQAPVILAIFPPQVRLSVNLVSKIDSLTFFSVMYHVRSYLVESYLSLHVANIRTGATSYFLSTLVSSKRLSRPVTAPTGVQLHRSLAKIGYRQLPIVAIRIVVTGRVVVFHRDALGL